MNQKEGFFVQVTMTPEQARSVVQALDLYLRVHIGQFNIIQEQFSGGRFDHRRVEDLLFHARDMIFPELSGRGHSYSASGCPNEGARISFDVLQVIRRAEAYGSCPEGGITVDFNDPLWVSDSLPRPTAKTVDILDRLADI